MEKGLDLFGKALVEFSQMDRKDEFIQKRISSIQEEMQMI